jgi:hypothetical protein
LHFFFGRQFQEVFGDEEIVVHACQGIFHQGAVLACAEQYADGRVVSLSHFICPVPANVSIELANVFMVEFSHLEFDQDMAFEDPVVKDQIDVELSVSDQNALLTGFKAKPMSQFQEEFLQVTQKLIFKIGFT